MRPCAGRTRYGWRVDALACVLACVRARVADGAHAAAVQVGEASPPPHCLANASTTEQLNDYMLKFRAVLA